MRLRRLFVASISMLLINSQRMPGILHWRTPNSWSPFRSSSRKSWRSPRLHHLSNLFGFIAMQSRFSLAIRTTGFTGQHWMEQNFWDQSVFWKSHAHLNAQMIHKPSVTRWRLLTNTFACFKTPGRRSHHEIWRLSLQVLPQLISGSYTTRLLLATDKIYPQHSVQSSLLLHGCV